MNIVASMVATPPDPDVYIRADHLQVGDFIIDPLDDRLVQIINITTTNRLVSITAIPRSPHGPSYTFSVDGNYLLGGWR